MKKSLKQIISWLLGLRGLLLIKKYQFDHLQLKYQESIKEIEQFFVDQLKFKVVLTEKEHILIRNLYGTSISEAFYLIHFLRQSMVLKGDVCEFGVANGSTSVLLGYEIKKTSKKLYLFDSFEGLSKPTHKDKLLDDIFHFGSMSKYEGTMSYDQQEVEQKLNSIKFPKSRRKIIKGFIEHSIRTDKKPQKVCFAYIDFDLYEPTKITLQFLHKTLSKGGHIIIDDYNFFSEGPKIAVDEFMSSHKSEYTFLLPLRFAGNFCILNKK